VEEQTKQVMKNLRAVLESAGSSLGRIVRATLYLADMNEFAVVNATYASFLDGHKPARATVEVSRLPKHARIEIDCVAEC
jgi:2-iminobutanoate/2-iminopropanoate deaminase